VAQVLRALWAAVAAAREPAAPAEGGTWQP
jgi:hypothetical protein